MTNPAIPAEPKPTDSPSAVNTVMEGGLPQPSRAALRLHYGGLAVIALESLRKELGGECWCKADKLFGHTYGCLMAQRAMALREQYEEGK